MPQGMEGKGPSLLGAPLGMNTAANEQTEPEELKENQGGTVGQAWGKAAFSGIPHPCPGLRSLCLDPKARENLAHRLGEGAHISLPTQSSSSQDYQRVAWGIKE